MIIQCDKCLSKFKLDDSKVTPQGVKVRCKKCSNIFVVYPEKPEEEFKIEFQEENLIETQKTPEKHAQFITEEKTNIDLPSFEFTLDNIKGEKNKSEEFVVKQETEKQEFSWDEFNLDFGEKTETAPTETSKQKQEAPQQEFDFESFGEVKLPVQEDVKKEPPQEQKSEVELNFDFDSFTQTEATKKPEPQQEEDTSNILEEFAFTEPASAPSGQVSQPPQEDAKEEQEFKFDFDEPDTSSKEIESTFDFEQELKQQETHPQIKEGNAEEFDFKQSEDFTFEEVGQDQTKFEYPADSKEEMESVADKTLIEEDFLKSPHIEKPFEDKDFEVPTQEEPQQPFEFEPVKPQRNWLTYLISILIVVLFSGTGVGLIWWQKTKILETEGNFGLTAVKTDFYESKTLDKVFVVQGNVVNGYRVAKSFIKIKATIKSRDNKVLVTKIVFAGNTFSPSEIKELTYPEIEKGLNNKMGKSMMNVTVPPGKSLPFMVVFDKIPENAVNVEVESL